MSKFNLLILSVFLLFTNGCGQKDQKAPRITDIKTSSKVLAKSDCIPTWVANTSQERMVGDYISTSYGSNNLAHGVFATVSARTSGTNCGSVPDNCVEPTSTFAIGLSASSSISSANASVLFSGNGGADANSLWNVVDDNGIKHR